MNKTLLLILCDFLLLTLLALARWDGAPPPKPAEQESKASSTDGASTPAQDMVAVMKQSLADEQSHRDELARSLAQTEALKLAAEQNGARLSESLAATKATAEKLDTALNATRADVTAERARAEQLARDLAVREAEAKRQREDLAKLEQAEAAARQRADTLAVSVKVAEKEKVMLTAQAEQLRAEVASERAERQKVQQTTVELVQGVGQLAEQSNALTREIIESRPINANTLFTSFLARRVSSHFAASRASFLGQVNRNRDTNTVVVGDGHSKVALLHVDDTPFNWLEPNGQADWASLTLNLGRDGAAIAVKQIDFLSLDPRIIAVPLSADDVAALKAEPYLTALDPFKFPDAVLISSGGKGYGELPFKLDPASPGYVRVDNRLMRRLFGEFSPSRGDLVLSKTGELLGVMVTGDLCALITNFLPQKSLVLGENLANAPTGPVLDSVAARYRTMPSRLQ